MKIAVVTTRAKELESFLHALTESGAELRIAGSEAEALDLAKTEPPSLIVVDAMPGADALAFVYKLVTVNAMINTAVVTAMEEEDFHEKSEGLGVLMALPPTPAAQEAGQLLDLLRKIAG